MDKDSFIIEDPSVLYKNRNFLKFLPISDMSRIEKLNSIIRFCIYYLIIIVLFKFDNRYAYIPFIGILISVILYYIYIYDPLGKYKELNIMQSERFNNNNDNININNGDNINYGYSGNSNSNGNGNGNGNGNSNGNDNHVENFERDYLTITEAGYYDSDGKLHLGPSYNMDTIVDDKNINYNYNELLEYQKNISRKPTKDNPFMNPPITDFNDKFKPAASNADDEDIKESVERYFNADLYRNIEDLYSNKNSQRQFYTIPTTAIPSNQTDFANWLFKPLNNCKTDQEMCLRYEDLRFKSIRI